MLFLIFEPRGLAHRWQSVQGCLALAAVFVTLTTRKGGGAINNPIKQALMFDRMIPSIVLAHICKLGQRRKRQLCENACYTLLSVIRGGSRWLLGACGPAAEPTANCHPTRHDPQNHPYQPTRSHPHRLPTEALSRPRCPPRRQPTTPEPEGPPDLTGETITIYHFGDLSGPYAAITGSARPWRRGCRGRHQRRGWHLRARCSRSNSPTLPAASMRPWLLTTASPARMTIRW